MQRADRSRAAPSRGSIGEVRAGHVADEQGVAGRAPPRLGRSAASRSSERRVLRPVAGRVRCASISTVAERAASSRRRSPRAGTPRRRARGCGSWRRSRGQGGRARRRGQRGCASRGRARSAPRAAGSGAGRGRCPTGDRRPRPPRPRVAHQVRAAPEVLVDYLAEERRHSSPDSLRSGACRFSGNSKVSQRSWRDDGGTARHRTRRACSSSTTSRTSSTSSRWRCASRASTSSRPAPAREALAGVERVPART